MSIFLVLAFARSGSSVLRHRLNAFPSIVIPPESTFAVWLSLNERPPGPIRCPRSARRTARAICDARKFEHWNISAEQLEAALLRDGVSTFAEAVQSTYKLYRDIHKPHATLIGDKNNWHIAVPQQALSVLSPQRTVLLWRDPVEVWASLSRLRELREAGGASVDGMPYYPTTPGNVDVFGENWSASYGQALTLLQQQRASHRVQSYADLVENPNEQLQSLAEFLGVGAEENPGEVAQSLMEPEDYRIWKLNVLEPISRSAPRSRAMDVGRLATSRIREKTAEVEERLRVRSDSCR
jgi:hypothetical protein